MRSADTLNQVADILEKAAAYIDSMEAEKQSAQHAAATQIANKLASRVEETIGEPIGDDLVEKLSGTDEDVQRIIQKLAGGEDVESMGGVEQEKTAGVTSGMGSAEQGFISWLST